MCGCSTRGPLIRIWVEREMGRRVQSGLSCCDRATDEWRDTAEEYDECNRRKTHGNATGYGLRYEYGMFRQSFVNGWQQENPDNWLRDGDPWEISRHHEKVDIKLNVTFKLRDGRVELTPGTPSTLFGIPFDRPVVGYGGKTINTLRLWAAAAADFFDLQEFGTGDFVGTQSEKIEEVANSERSGVPRAMMSEAV